MKFNLGLRKSISYLILFTSILLISCSNKEDDNTSVENLLIGTWVHSDLVEGYTEKYVFYEGGDGVNYYNSSNYNENFSFRYTLKGNKLIIDDIDEVCTYIIKIENDKLTLTLIDDIETVSTIFDRE